MWAEGSDADAVIEARGLKQITDGGAIEKVIDEIMAANPEAARRLSAPARTSCSASSSGRP